MMSGVRELIAKYIELRDRRDELEAAHKERLAPIRELMTQIEQGLLAYLQEQGADNIKAAGAGTAYVTEVLTLRVVDRDAALTHIMDNGLLDLLQWSVNKTAYREHGEVPGVEAVRAMKVNIRRA